MNHNFLTVVVTWKIIGSIIAYSEIHNKKYKLFLFDLYTLKVWKSKEIFNEMLFWFKGRKAHKLLDKWYQTIISEVILQSREKQRKTEIKIAPKEVVLACFFQ